MKRGRWKSILLTGIIAAMAAGCAGSYDHDHDAMVAAEAKENAARKAAAEAKPQRLVVAIGHALDYIGVDPFVAGRENTLLATAIYEPLALEGPDGTIEPALATSWQSSPDGLTWTFTLRQGVKFHDGSDFDAEAVEAAFRHYMQDPTTGPRLGIKELRAEGPHAVTFVLEKPSAAFLGVVGSFSAVIPAPAAHDASGQLVKPIGTGPFQVKKAERQQVELVAFDGHWRARPKLDEVVFRYLPDPSTMVMSLEAGEVDLIGADGFGIPRSDIKRLEAIPGLQSVIELQDTSIEWIGFNLKREPLADSKVRQAINMAVDKQSLVQHLLEGFGEPAVGPLHYDPAAPWVHPAIKGWEYDPDRAQRLLAEAGWKDSDGDGVLDQNGKPLKLSLLFEGTRDWKLYAEALQQDLARVGIKLDLQMRDTGVIRDLQKQGEYDLVALGGIGKNLVEPNYYFFYYYSSRGPGSVLKDPKLDAQIFRLTATLDRGEREKLYHSIQEQIWAAVPGIYLVHPARVSITRSDVIGWRTAGTMDPMRWLYQVSRQ